MSKLKMPYSSLSGYTIADNCSDLDDINGYGLAKWGNYTHKSPIILQMLNKTTKDE